MKDSICWDCKWSTGLYGVCSWALRYEPVKGWNAIRRDLRYGRRKEVSYRVFDCPLFRISDRTMEGYKYCAEICCEEELQDEL